MQLRTKLILAGLASLLLVVAVSVLLFRGPGRPGAPAADDGHATEVAPEDGGARALAPETEDPPLEAADSSLLAQRETQVATPAQADSGPGWTLAGRTVRRDAEAGTVSAVAGVTVIVRGHPRQTKPEDAPPPIRVATGDDGRFEVQGVKPDVKLRLELDEPSSALRALSFRLGTPDADARRDLGDIPLEPASTLTINVLGPDGTPVEKAEVLVGRDISGDFPPGQHALDELGFKDSRRDVVERGGGVYALERTGPGPHSVRVTARGCAPWTGTADLPRAEPLEVRLLAGHAIAGIVRGTDGKPIARATVEVDSGPGIINPDPQTKTDAAGRFRFDNLAAGAFELSAVAEGYALDERQAVAADTEDLAFVLEREAIVAGKVVTEKDGAPVAGATVRLQGATGKSFSGKTGDDGSFSVRQIAPGTYAVEADHSDHGSAIAESRELEAGQTVNDLVLKLPAGFTARARVTDATTRAPVPDATVTFVLQEPADGGQRGRRRQGKTDGEGVATIKGLSPGGWEHSAQAKGFLRSKPGRVSIEGDLAAPVAITLDPGASVAGRVVDRTGRPVAGATVRPAIARLTPQDWNAGFGNQQLSAQSGTDGTFLLEGLLPHDSYTLTATHGEYAGGVHQELKLGEREAVEGVEIILLRGGTIRGRVLDGGDEPLAGAVVTLAREREPAAAEDEMEQPRWPGQRSQERAPSASSGEDGSFTLSHVAPGTYTVQAKASDRLPASASGVAVADEQSVEDVDLKLANGESLAGRVEDAAGEPLPGASVQVGGVDGQKLTGADGRFEIAGVAPGSVNVNVSLAGYQSSQLETKVPGKELAVRLERSATIAGAIRAPRPVELRNAQVMALLQGADGQGSGPAFSQRAVQDGRYEIELRAGSYVVRANVPGFPAAYSRRVTLRAGERVDDADIDLREGGRISGTVVLRGSGEPVREASVTVQGVKFEAWDVTWFTPSAQTDAAGAFTIEGVPDGVFSLHAQHADYTPGRQEGVTVRAGSTVDVRLELGEGGGIRGLVTRGGSAAKGRVVLAVKAQDSAQGAAVEQKTANVAADGSFAMRGLSTGTYTLYLQRNSWNGFGGRQSTRTVEVREGEVTEVQWDEAAGIRLYGTVMAGGAPLAGRTLQLLQPGGAGDGGRARTGPAGEYAIEVAGPGTYLAFLDARGGGTKVEIVVPAGVTEHRHDIEIAGGQIAGSVVDAVTGAPVAGAQVIALEAGASERSFQQILAGMRSATRTDDAGRFALQGLEPGDYTLRVMAAGHADGFVDRVVLPREGVAKDERIELEAGVELRLRVLDASGRALPEARAVVRDAAGSLVRLDGRESSDGEGVLAIPGLRPAPHEVTIVHASYAPARIVADAAAGEGPAVQLTPGGSVLARVTDRRGRPVAGATVDLLDERGDSVIDAVVLTRLREGPGSQAFQTHADGTLSLHHVPVGRLRAVAILGESRSREERVTVEEGGTVGVEMKLSE